MARTKQKETFSFPKYAEGETLNTISGKSGIVQKIVFSDYYMRWAYLLKAEDGTTFDALENEIGWRQIKIGEKV